MKIKKITTIILSSIFILGIILGITGKILSIDSPKDYRKRQNEILVPEVIGEVWISNERIYLCYPTATAVNVYDLDGNFLWAVSAPYMKEAEFSVTEDKLVIYSAEAFVYDSQNGEFITVTASEMNTPTAPASPTETDSKYRFGWYNVYVTDQNGNESPIITRPAWYGILNFYICFAISAISALGIGMIAVMEKIAARIAASGKGSLTHRKAKFYLIYLQIAVAVHVLSAILNVFFCSWTLMAVLSVHFAAAGIIIYNLIENLSCTKYEKIVFDFWKALAISSYVLLFLSMAFCF